MAKQIKDSEQIIVGTSKNSTQNGKFQFFVSHRDVTDGNKITVGEEAIGDFMIAMAKKREFCKKYKCKLYLTKWEQVMA